MKQNYLKAATVMPTFSTVASLNTTSTSNTAPPQLNGQSFRITVIPEPSFLEINQEDGDTANIYSGFLIDMLNALAAENRANFNYTLVTPTGLGSFCNPQLQYANDTSLYSDTYWGQYDCGTSDVNENVGDQFSTDMYLGMYYVSPVRQLRNYFTMPFAPPHKATPALYGTATRIRDIPDLAEQQKQGKQPVAWAPGATAILDYVQSRFPDLEIKPFFGSVEDLDREMDAGRIQIYITGAPAAQRMVNQRAQHGQCIANGMPVGMIGEPMSAGLSHIAIGVGKHVPRHVVDTLSYWINILMSCNPNDEFGQCPEGNLAQFYKKSGGGTGNECGYVMYPPLETEPVLSKGAIAGIVTGAVAFVIILFSILHYCKLKRQEKRYKERFVQQIARNIEIGPSPGNIPAEKLAEEIALIAEGKATIGKEDLRKWIHDVKLEFITEKDFDALWNAIDVNGNGEVDPIEFIVFLSACGPEFEKVYKKQERLPKQERLKLAARRLTNLATYGEEGVRRIENKYDASSRLMGTGV